MKMLSFAFVTLFSLGALANGQEVLRYTCNPFQMPGKVLRGARAPQIVELRNDILGGTTLAIKNQALAPEAQPHYEALAKVFTGVDNSQWTSQHYDVSFFFSGGLRAHIQVKNSTGFANCIAVGQ